MITKGLFLAAAILTGLGLLLAACGGGATPPEPLNITITGKDIAFDVTTITARVAQQVNITYINTGILDHTFFIEGMVPEQKVAPGQTINFTFTPPAAGTYTYVCNVAGHKEAGMVGTLTVNP